MRCNAPVAANYCDPDICVSYYQYISPTAFTSYCNSGDWHSIAPACIVDRINIISVNANAAGGIYYDAQGNVLSGVIYGVRKDKGPWNACSLCMTSYTLTYGTNKCGNDRFWAINQSIK